MYCKKFRVFQPSHFLTLLTDKDNIALVNSHKIKLSLLAPKIPSWPILHNKKRQDFGGVACNAHRTYQNRYKIFIQGTIHYR